MARYKLIDLGRAKYNGEVEVESELQLVRECKKHLASQGVEIQWKHEDTQESGMVTAGFHRVGWVEIVREPLQGGKQ